MANRYAVKSAVLTFGGETYDMATGPAMKAETKEAVDTTALSDSVKQFITGALKGSLTGIALRRSNAKTNASPPIRLAKLAKVYSLDTRR